MPLPKSIKGSLKSLKESEPNSRRNIEVTPEEMKPKKKSTVGKHKRQIFKIDSRALSNEGRNNSIIFPRANEIPVERHLF